jgi:hypothetical protein
MVPEQISTVSQGALDACLVDAWGRVFVLSERTEIGRQPEGAGISIHQASISRRHAVIERNEVGAFIFSDLGSTNGSRISHRKVVEPVALVSGDLIYVGFVGFYFVTPLPPLRGAGSMVMSHTTASRLAIRNDDDFPSFEHTDAYSQETLPIKIIEATGGGGGFVDIAGKQIQISVVQLELLSLLMNRMIRDKERPIAVRGYIHSSEILAAVSWDTAHPSDNHVKQLVRRLRRSLARSGRNDLIESQQGLGYRLSVIPR